MSKNYLALDMDGVLNSDFLIEKWKKEAFDRYKGEYSGGSYFRLTYQRVREEFMKEFVNCKELVFPELAERLTKLVRKHDIKIIWSSSWRHLKCYQDIEKAREMFDRRGLPGDALVVYTPNRDNRISKWEEVRVSEIRWCKQQKLFGINDKSKLAALDDLNLSELEDYGIRFFKTEEYTGLTEEIAANMDEYFSK